MNQLITTAQTAMWNITNRLNIKDVLDILIVAVIIYELIQLIRRTRSSAVLKGLLLLLVATGISNLFGLTALNWLLMSVISYGALVLFILFQPEIRKALEQIGRATLFEHHDNNTANSDMIIHEIVQCALDLSRRRVGALVVFERKTGLNDVIETGTRIDATISAPLLENIFEPNTPLHDGAVIIRGPRVVAAACILTLTESRNVSRDLGTRHRAGIGVSEQSDALVLIVSEETGIISIVRGGQITRNMNEESLTQVLREVYEEQTSGITSILKRFGKERRS